MTQYNYVIWHAPRTGSNLLCNYLSKLGNAGFASYPNAGFFVGHGAAAGQNWPDKVDEYLNMMRTDNGVSGTKASFEYFRDMWPYIGWNGVQYVLNKFQDHIVLDRRDKVAQAVSFLFASHTKQFTSQAPAEAGIGFPDYDPQRIGYIIAQLSAYTYQMVTFLHVQRIPYLPVWYEALKDSPLYELQAITSHLYLQTPHELPTPDIQQQTHTEKTAMIERYKNEHGEATAYNNRTPKKGWRL